MIVPVQKTANIPLLKKSVFPPQIDGIVNSTDLMTRIPQDVFTILANMLPSESVYVIATTQRRWCRWVNAFAKRVVERRWPELFDRYQGEPLCNWGAIYCYKLRVLENLKEGRCSFRILHWPMRTHIEATPIYPAHLIVNDSMVFNLRTGLKSHTFRLEGTKWVCGGLLWKYTENYGTLEVLDPLTGECIFSTKLDQFVVRVYQVQGQFMVLTSTESYGFPTQCYFYSLLEKVLKPCQIPVGFHFIREDTLNYSITNERKEPICHIIWCRFGENHIGLEKQKVVSYPTSWNPSTECIPILEEKDFSFDLQMRESFTYTYYESYHCLYKHRPLAASAASESTELTILDSDLKVIRQELTVGFVLNQGKIVYITRLSGKFILVICQATTNLKMISLGNEGDISIHSMQKMDEGYVHIHCIDIKKNTPMHWILNGETLKLIKFPNVEDDLSIVYGPYFDGVCMSYIGRNGVRMFDFNKADVRLEPASGIAPPTANPAQPSICAIL